MGRDSGWMAKPWKLENHGTFRDWLVMIVLRYPQEGIWFLSPLHKFCYAKRGPLSGLVGEAMWKSWIKRETFNGNLMPKWKSRAAAGIHENIFLLQIIKVFLHSSIINIFFVQLFFVRRARLHHSSDETLLWSGSQGAFSLQQSDRCRRHLGHRHHDHSDLDHPSSWRWSSSKELASDITTHIDHHQLQYPNSKELKIWKCLH